jgi:hypothetical protein
MKIVNLLSNSRQMVRLGQFRYTPSASAVKQLRDLTGYPIGECQKALKEVIILKIYYY